MTLDELQKLCDEATPEYQFIARGEMDNEIVKDSPASLRLGPWYGGGGNLWFIPEGDARFYVATREWMPKLIEAVKSAEALKVEQERLDRHAYDHMTLYSDEWERLGEALTPFRGKK